MPKKEKNPMKKKTHLDVTGRAENWFAREFDGNANRTGKTSLG